MTGSKGARRRTATGQQGQVLALFVLFLGALMGFVALAIDVGLFLHERRSLQNAADAAALAGAAELPDPIAARDKALEWASKNGYGDDDDDGFNDDDDAPMGITVTTPYKGNPNAVEVVIETDVPFFFARVLGMDSAHVSARAVAARDPGGGYAIYAHGTICGAPREIDISGSTLDVDGDIHSNGDVKINSSNGDIEGAVTYVCSQQTGGQPLDVDGGINQVSQPRDWPVYHDYSEFGPCTFYVNGNMEISSDTPQYWVNETPRSGSLKPGVYCAEGDIHLSGADFSGNVTFVARHEVHFSGARFNFRPYRHDVVAFAGKSDPCTKRKCDTDAAIHISSSSFTWRGVLLAPGYVVQFSSSTAYSEEGSILGEFVKISASTMNISAWGDSGGGPPRLVE